MAKSQARSKRKKTGGRLHKFRDKRKSRLAREAVPISVGKEKKKVIRIVNYSVKRGRVSEESPAREKPGAPNPGKRKK